VARRAALVTEANPAPRLSYQVTLGACLTCRIGRAPRARITVDYIPDLVLLDPAGFSRYMNVLGRTVWGGPEALGIAILDDMNNEVVPRWVRVTVRAQGDETSAPKAAVEPGSWHRVILEDRQPRWDEDTASPFGDGPVSPRRG